MAGRGEKEAAAWGVSSEAEGMRGMDRLGLAELERAQWCRFECSWQQQT